MKPPPSKGTAPRRTRLRLEVIAGALVVAGLLFSLYCGLQATFPSRPGEGSSARPLKLLNRSLRQQHEGEGGESDSEGTATARRQRMHEVAAAQASPCPVPEAKVETKTVTKLVYGVQTNNERTYHVITTAQGFPNHWQARVHYYWYKKQRDACRLEPPCDMGGFTRLLHSGEADDLMDEVPTVVVDHLPASILKDSSYVVLNRPYAFLMWLARTSIPERYILMAEADHLFLRPLPNLMNGEAAGAALFSYMVPANYPSIVRKFVGQVSDDEIRKVPQIGNSPTFVSVADFRKLAPVWYNTTIDIFNDAEAHAAWNWILEMYGYTIATYRTGQHVNMKVYPNLLAHPPFDRDEVHTPTGLPFYIVHLTYPCRFASNGSMIDALNETVWSFDKRDYSALPPPRNLAMPPANVQNQLVRDIIAMLNEATATIPCWDQYVKDRTVTRICPAAAR